MKAVTRFKVQGGEHLEGFSGEYGMVKASLEKWDHGPSIRAKVNMPLMTTETAQSK